MAFSLLFGPPGLSQSVGVVLRTTTSASEDEQGFQRIGLTRVSSLKLLPSRVLSRAYGAISHLTLPVAMRPAVYGLWSWVFKVKLDEADCASLAEYRHLTEFFTRRLKPGCRQIDERKHVLTSPVDGAVVSLSCDLSSRGVLRQVKGIDYHVCDFLGLSSPPIMKQPGKGGVGLGAGDLNGQEQNAVIGDGGTALFSAVLYLAPGDYHAFHSPTEWSASSRAHIAGQLLPVNPMVVKVIPSLFCANERVALLGQWAPSRPQPLCSPGCEAGETPSEGQWPPSRLDSDESSDSSQTSQSVHTGVEAAGSGRSSGRSSGASMFFSYTAVGATNVGSIRLLHEPGLVTNSYKHDWACGFSPRETAAAAGDLPKPLGTGMACHTRARSHLRASSLCTVLGPTDGTGSLKAVSSKGALAPVVSETCDKKGGLSALAPHLSITAPSPHLMPPRQRHYKEYGEAVHFKRGEDVGVFELGSTIVLIFEAPVDFKWTIREGDKVRVGQALGSLPALRCTCTVSAAGSDAFSQASPQPQHPVKVGPMPAQVHCSDSETDADDACSSTSCTMSCADQCTECDAMPVPALGWSRVASVPLTGSAGAGRTSGGAARKPAIDVVELLQAVFAPVAAVS